MLNQAPKISVVTTMYYSEPYISEFYSRITKVLETITPDYEIVFVNDGSPDNSLELTLKLKQKDERITIVDLSKNFGHHQAILTGLNHANGEYVFLIDSDLEEDPELLKMFWDTLSSESAIDVVYGEQHSRKGKWFERVSGRIFYNLLDFLTDLKYPKDTTTARLMTRDYVKSVLSHTEKELDIWTIFILTGFNQVALKVNKKSKGETTYTFLKKLRIAVNIITSTTSKPLYYVFSLGIIITILSIFYILYIIINRFMYNDIVEGWTSLIISVWFIGGLLMMSIGVVGIYLSKIFKEVKNRPHSIVKEKF